MYFVTILLITQALALGPAAAIIFSRSATRASEKDQSQSKKDQSQSAEEADQSMDATEVVSFHRIIREEGTQPQLGSSSVSGNQNLAEELELMGGSDVFDESYFKNNSSAQGKDEFYSALSNASAQGGDDDEFYSALSNASAQGEDDDEFYSALSNAVMELPIVTPVQEGTKMSGEQDEVMELPIVTPVQEGTKMSGEQDEYPAVGAETLNPTEALDMLQNLVIDKNDRYGRGSHSSQNELEKELATKFKAGKDNVVLTTSGMQAIFLAFQGILEGRRAEKLHILYSSELYTESPRTIKYLAEMHGECEVETVDVWDNDAVEVALARHPDRSVVLFAEGVSNPSGRVMDLDFIKKQKNKLNKEKKKLINRHGQQTDSNRELLVVVDHTWVARPMDLFKFGVDLVVLSLTKYFSADTVILGAVIAHNHKKFTKPMREWVKFTGNHVSPVSTRLVLRQLPSVEERLKAAGESALRLADWLSKRNDVMKVKYPLVAASADKNLKLYKKYYGDVGPGVIAFQIPATLLDAKKAMQASQDLPYETSFGKDRAMLDPWPSHRDGGTWIRLAVGYKQNWKEVARSLESVLKDAVRPNLQLCRNKSDRGAAPGPSNESSA